MKIVNFHLTIKAKKFSRSTIVIDLLLVVVSVEADDASSLGLRSLEIGLLVLVQILRINRIALV